MTANTRERKIVVAGLLVDGPRLLVTQRRPGGPLGGLWEFPGGKLEAGEAPTQALVRELREEIGIDVTVGPIWDVLSHAYPLFDVLLLVYACRSAEPHAVRALEIAAWRWVTVDELDSVDLLPADKPLRDRLMREGVPGW